MGGEDDRIVSDTQSRMHLGVKSLL